MGFLALWGDRRPLFTRRGHFALVTPPSQSTSLFPLRVHVCPVRTLIPFLIACRPVFLARRSRYVSSYDYLGKPHLFFFYLFLVLDDRLIEAWASYVLGGLADTKAMGRCRGSSFFFPLPLLAPSCSRPRTVHCPYLFGGYQD